MPRQTLRIIDANCNRIGEGMRFLEDVARFALNNASLSKRLRTLRHDLIKNVSPLGIKLISARDSSGDVGATAASMSQQQDLPSLLTANAKRVEEGLRVLEELAKLPEMSQALESELFQRMRFELYTIEKELLLKILRQQKMAQLTGLYVIVDTQVLGTRDAIAAAAQAIRGGAKIIQFRDKHSEKGKLLATAQKLKDLCQRSNVLFLINDHLDIALAADADGLHLGQEDLPLPVARRELPVDKIIGCSTTNLKQALKAAQEGADYIAVGAIFPTPTRKDYQVVGIERLQQVKRKISIPVVAIGGINQDNIREIMAAGADSAAVISAILNQDDIETATQEMVKKIAPKRKGNRKSGKNR